MNECPQILLFSDGGAEPNPGRGGYGLILSYKNITKEFKQGYRLTTNNRMELLGVITGLEKIKVNKAQVEVYTDSRYVIDGIEKGWAKKWQANNWYRTKSQKAINSDLWQRLLALLSQHDVHFNWVKGHNGHPQNERCDELATLALQSTDLLVDANYEVENPDAIVKEVNKSSISKPSKNSDLKKNKGAKILKAGDHCRKCDTPVIVKQPKDKKLKKNQNYYYDYYLYCPQCHTMYFIEEAKRFV